MTTRGYASKITDSIRAKLPATLRDRACEHTHALICRLTPEADEGSMGRQFQALFAQFASGPGKVHIQRNEDTLPLAPSSGFCVDRFPFPSTSKMARRQCAKEAARPLSGSAGQVMRATILGYSDGQRDFVLVCDRTLLDQRGLYLAAAFCLSSAPASILVEAPAPHIDASSDTDELVNSSFSPILEWGEAPLETGVNVIELPLDADIAPEYWLSALGWVVSRWHAIASPAVASLQERSDPTTSILPGAAGYRLINLPSDAGASIASTVEHSRAQLQDAPFLTDSLLSELKDRCDQPVDISIGVLFPASLPFDVACVLRYEYVPCHSPIFPLTLVVGSNEDRRLSCYLDSSVHAASSIEWLLHCLIHTVTQFARADTGSLAEIELLSSEAQQRVAALGRGLDAPPAAPCRIEEAFRQVSAARPNAIALSYGDEGLTYAQLDDLSTRLAKVLIDRGVAHDSFVGICLRRSVPVVVAMLAILKCGAVYVPMDPDYPADRLRYTAEDAGLKLVITEEGTSLGVPGMIGIGVGELIREAEAKLGGLPAMSGSDSSAAYMIYTSGSTGRPKGVLIPHRNVMSLIRATRERFGLSSTDAWTLFHSSAFDFSVWEIWGCLLTGGHLIIVSHAISRDPDQFRELINSKSVSVLNQTPSAFYQLIEADQRESIGDSLRLVIFGGEALDTRALLRWFDRHPESQCRLVNMFGITETTVHVTWQEVRRRQALGASRSVGCPIPEWHVYVMDDGQQMLPPGAIGEIYVGGAGVASGYHNRPDLTQLRFVRDPYTGGMMYRSGDRGRLLSNGNLEHLGRLDNQIKLRGFRIELDEIRRIMLKHSAVKAAAVVFNQPNQKDTGSARIDAYLVAENAHVADIRGHVSRFLPEHMVPSTFTFVPTMPMTTNGKLDTKRLPPPEVSKPTPSKATGCGDEKSSGAADMMLSIWQSVLGRKISLDDNFFDLGGNSLIAIRIASAMRGEGLPPLPMNELYTHQTIRNLVTALSL